MKFLLTRDDVYTLDKRCADEAGIAPSTLMENAGRSAAHILQALLPSKSGLRILIACGGGNNGGDGLVMARLLRDVHDVTLLRHDDESSWDSLDNIFDVVVDALIGVGGGTELRSPVDQHVAFLNTLRGLHVAVDVPTGLDATTGLAHADAFRADTTITMAAAKTGFYRNAGPSHVGTVYIADIGAPSNFVEEISQHSVFTRKDIRQVLPTREPNTSKFNYGRVLVIGGSRAMRGAPALTAHAALAMGAGIVELAAPTLHPLIPREVMTHVLPSSMSGPTAGSIARDAFASITEVVNKATVLAIGPGVGTDAAAVEALAELVNGLKPNIPVVIDADGLRMLPLLERPMQSVVLTPHLGEFARMLGKEVEAIRPRIVEEAIAYALAHECIVHVKDVPSVTTDGRRVIYCVNGNPGMATAGSGDVLTGFIAGLCAQRLNVFNAASLGAYLHACAGDYYAETQAMETLTATGLIHALGSVIPNE